MANDPGVGKHGGGGGGAAPVGGTGVGLVRAERPPAAGVRRRRWSRWPSRGTLWYLALGLALGCVAAGAMYLATAGRPFRKALAEGPDVVGSSPSQLAQLPADMVFTASTQKPERTPDLIPADAKEVLCFFEFSDASPDAQLRATWRQPGAEATAVDPEAVRVDRQADHLRGVLALRAATQSGLPVGIHEVEIADERGTVGFASFAVAKEAAAVLDAVTPTGGQLRVTSLVATDSIGADGTPGATRTEFPQVGRIYAAFRYADAEPGMAFTVRWAADDAVIAQASQEVAIGARDGWGQAWIETSAGSPLPAAEYTVMVFLPGAATPAAEEHFTVR